MGTMMLRGLAFLLLCQLAFSKKKPDHETPPDDWGQDKMEFRLYTKGKKYGYNLIGYNGPVVSPTEFTERRTRTWSPGKEQGSTLPSERCSPSMVWVAWTLVFPSHPLSGRLEQTSTLSASTGRKFGTNSQRGLT